MKNRMISYGYGIREGKLCVIEEEAVIVVRIYREYTEGKILKEIAERLTAEGVEYYAGNCTWSKNMVSRILENRKYIGEDAEYPAIVSIELFERAAKKRNEKSCKQVKPREETECLKKIVYCGQCGQPLHRRAKWKTREKWYCLNGCKVEKYIADSVIFDGVLTIARRVKENPLLLNREEESETYTKTPEIMRYQNEISRMTGEAAVSFKAGKQLILACASKKFAACKENRHGAYTRIVEERTKRVADMQTVNSEYIEEVIDRITVDKCGTIRAAFINGSELSDGV